MKSTHLALFAAALAACADRRAQVIEAHVDSPVVTAVERLGDGGDFHAGARESFRAVHASSGPLRWAASAGQLVPDGDLATWELPDAPEATLEVTGAGADGREVTSSFRFAIRSRAAGAPAGPIDNGPEPTGSN